MSTNRIDSNSPATMTIETTRMRQTERPATPFRDVLATSVGVLASGAQVATGVVAGPLAAAAVRQVGASVQGGIAGQPAGPAAVSSEMEASTAIAAAGGGNDLSSMHAMQQDSQVFNMQLLALQNEVQQDNQRFSTVSNLMRARHDTAKSAISNIRS